MGPGRVVSHRGRSFASGVVADGASRTNESGHVGGVLVPLWVRSAHAREGKLGGALTDL